MVMSDEQARQAVAKFGPPPTGSVPEQRSSSGPTPSAQSANSSGGSTSEKADR